MYIFKRQRPKHSKIYSESLLQMPSVCPGLLVSINCWGKEALPASAGNHGTESLNQSESLQLAPRHKHHL